MSPADRGRLEIILNSFKAHDLGRAGLDLQDGRLVGLKLLQRQFLQYRSSAVSFPTLSSAVMASQPGPGSLAILRARAVISSSVNCAVAIEDPLP